MLHQKESGRHLLYTSLISNLMPELSFVNCCSLRLYHQRNRQPYECKCRTHEGSTVERDSKSFWSPELDFHLTLKRIRKWSVNESAVSVLISFKIKDGSPFHNHLLTLVVNVFIIQQLLIRQEFTRQLLKTWPGRDPAFVTCWD